jgi:rhodanese-related sulfurtransferase
VNDDNIGRRTPPEAWKILNEESGAILLDVRSKVEYDYVGHPPGAVHVAWKEYPDWKQNPGFVNDVRAALNERGGDDPSRPILAICRSGARSLAAAKALANAGYQRLYNVEEGFEGDKDGNAHRGTINGWRFHGLPWEQT